MKVSVGITNNFCPQTLFLYGTYKEDGSPDFGLFCWISYHWDGEMGVMACIGGNKLTKDLIRKNGVFSANLVSEKMLPLADYYGTTSGYSENKMKIMPDVMKGKELNVPIIVESPVSFELQVKQEIHMNDGDVFLCKICNVMMEEDLNNNEIPLEERVRLAAPVITVSNETYFAVAEKSLGHWGEPGKQYKKNEAE